MTYKTVSAFEAKTHLSGLLAQVQKGEGFLITKHNEPVALLLPAKQKVKRPIAEVIAALIQFRKSHKLKSLTIKELKEEGRR